MRKIIKEDKKEMLEVFFNQLKKIKMQIHKKLANEQLVQLRKKKLKKN